MENLGILKNFEKKFENMKSVIIFLSVSNSSWDNFARLDKVSYWYLTILSLIIRMVPSRKFCFYPNSLLNGLTKGKILRQIRYSLFLHQKYCRNCNPNNFCGCLYSDKNNMWEIMVPLCSYFMQSCSFIPTAAPLADHFCFHQRKAHSIHAFLVGNNKASILVICINLLKQ